jgi:hypothetical protein
MKYNCTTRLNPQWNLGLLAHEHLRQGIPIPIGTGGSPTDFGRPAAGCRARRCSGGGLRKGEPDLGSVAMGGSSRKMGDSGVFGRWKILAWRVYKWSPAVEFGR